MFRGAALAGLMLATIGVPSAMAGSVPIWLLMKQCEASPGTVKLCSHQYTSGNRNWSYARQTTVVTQPTTSSVFSVIVQRGDDNVAYTGQTGTNLSSKTIQKGDGNFAGTYQEGSDIESKTIQVGDGIWSGTSSIGDDNKTSVVVHTW